MFKRKKTEKEKVTIIGLGRIGKTFFDIFKKNKNLEIFSFDKKHKDKNIDIVLEKADYIFLCIPSYEIRKFILKNKKHITEKSLIVLISKGLEEKTFKLPFEIIKELLPRNNFAVLGGPLMAEEVVQNKGGACVLASSFKNFLKIKEIFKDSGIYFEYSSDFKGVSLGGMLKNIYTFFLAAVDLSGLGLNMKGFFISKILKEMEKISELLGGKRETIKETSGLGDLIATSFSPHSRNRNAALLFFQNKSLKMKCEGIVSLRVIFKLKEIKKNIKKFPILYATYQLFILKHSQEKIFKKLLS